MLRLVLPKGSLEKATFDLFENADLPENEKAVFRVARKLTLNEQITDAEFHALRAAGYDARGVNPPYRPRAANYFAGAECASPLCGWVGFGPTPPGSSLVVFGIFSAFVSALRPPAAGAPPFSLR